MLKRAWIEIRVSFLFTLTIRIEEGCGYWTKNMCKPLQVTVTNCEERNPKKPLFKFIVGKGEYSVVPFFISTCDKDYYPLSAGKLLLVFKALLNNDCGGLAFAVMEIRSHLVPL
mmetsp:Transcript_46814/g.54715  ORF Transcript_46814/g.54715 Transcript_46814/m.54715 type:complete len:114 (+) Transcript_46814:149-490(+)